ncbi:putative membrane protein [Finch poxvirus]|uniref:Membrane protein n=3 Tax=Avipoxvirus TaxID=10260 RepID=A0AAT9UQD4_9POXV|nr:putative IMV membrane protein [Canarypox virus]UOX38696.1 putative membrane protein [Finch poxvirus]UOX39031.1 putative membrane protein [Finch poxvirus]
MELTRETLIFVGITILVVVMIISGFSLILRLIPGVYSSVARSSFVGGKILRFMEIFSTVMFIPSLVILYTAYIRKSKVKNN